MASYHARFTASSKNEEVGALQVPEASLHARACWRSLLSTFQRLAATRRPQDQGPGPAVNRLSGGTGVGNVEEKVFHHSVILFFKKWTAQHFRVPGPVVRWMLRYIRRWAGTRTLEVLANTSIYIQQLNKRRCSQRIVMIYSNKVCFVAISTIYQ